MTQRLKWFLKINGICIPSSLTMIFLALGFRRDLLKFDLIIGVILPLIMSYFSVYVFKLMD